MCGRYFLNANLVFLLISFKLKGNRKMIPCNNAAPTQEILTVINEGER